jgi:Spy/CpxP family protein refolding chaperone
MNRNKILTITAVMAVLLLTVGTGLSLARGGMGMRGPGMRSGSPLLGCVYKLNLSAETKTAIDTLVQKHRDSNKQSWQDNKAKMKTLNTNYFKALTASPLDEAALTAAQNEIITQMQTQMEARIQSRFELNSAIVKLLTPEELASVATCLESEAPREGMPGRGGREW